MTRPCFALTLLFGSLATTMLAVSTARCQIIVTLWDADVVAKQDDQKSQKSRKPMVLRDEADDEKYGEFDAAGFYDDYLVEDYLYDNIGGDANRAEEEEDAAVRAASKASVKKASVKKVAADDQAALDPEAKYADDFASEYADADYDCFGYDCHGNYLYDDEYGFRYSCPLAEQAVATTSDGDADDAVEADPYDFHADYDPVYDEVMFGDECPVESQSPVAAAANTPQAWDDYNYDTGYDYESEYYEWYATGDEAATESKAAGESKSEDAVDAAADEYGYDEYGYDEYGYDEAEFEQAYSEYWNGGETPAEVASSDKNEVDENVQPLEAEADGARETDPFAVEVQEAAARTSAACVNLGVRARNEFLLLVASTLDRVSGSLQDASHGLARIAGADDETVTR